MQLNELLSLIFFFHKKKILYVSLYVWLSPLDHPLRSLWIMPTIAHLTLFIFISLPPFSPIHITFLSFSCSSPPFSHCLPLSPISLSISLLPYTSHLISPFTLLSPSFLISLPHSLFFYPSFLPLSRPFSFLLSLYFLLLSCSFPPSSYLSRLFPALSPPPLAAERGERWVAINILFTSSPPLVYFSLSTRTCLCAVSVYATLPSNI